MEQLYQLRSIGLPSIVICRDYHETTLAIVYVPVPVDTWKRNLSPLEMWTTPNCLTILEDTVPLPEAGAPNITALKAAAARHVDIATMGQSQLCNNPRSFSAVIVGDGDDDQSQLGTRDATSDDIVDSSLKPGSA